MSVKVIVTDMDGTFLNDAKTYNQPRFMAQYQELKKRGIKKLKVVFSKEEPIKPQIQEEENEPEVKEEAEKIVTVGDAVEQIKNKIA